MSAETHVAETVISSSHYWLAIGIFVFTFIVIVSEKIHKTKAAMAGAAATLGLSIVSQDEAFYSHHLGIDHGVIFLLIGMMILVNIMGQSGIFEWSAVWMAKKAKGQPFNIMVLFLLFTAVFSALLDNVTTVLLFAPVTLLICDELDINPIPFLIMEAIASNIGGTATLIGDPPNLIIGARAKLGFMEFVKHLGPAVIVMLGALLVVTWFLFKKKLVVDEDKREHIMQMDEKRLIKDKSLATKSIIIMSLVTIGFATHGITHIEPATIALCGAAILLLISNLKPHDVLAEVEWTTIYFFIGLFIVVGGVVKVGFVSDLSTVVIDLTNPTQDSMFATSMVLLWFSGFASAFLDNIPYVATMAPLVGEMSATILPGGDAINGGPIPLDVLHHPVVMPVWWSLALGSCLGGNGTPIGASANVVVLGIAERAGQKISFLKFMAYGMPVMVLTLAIATVYVWLRYY